MHSDRCRCYTDVSAGADAVGGGIVVNFSIYNELFIHFDGWRALFVTVRKNSV